MQIRVRNTSGKLVSGELTMFIHAGQHAYASLDTAPPFTLKAAKRLRVSDELAYNVLGAVRRLCPFGGQSGVPGGLFSSSGYVIQEEGSDGEYHLRGQCFACGYSTGITPGNLLNFSVVAGMVHPTITYLTAEVGYARFGEAEWDPVAEMLIPATRELYGELNIIRTRFWQGDGASLTVHSVSIVDA